VDVGIAARPAIGDADGDGDLDLVSGEQNGGHVYYENSGSAASPAFVLRTGAGSPVVGVFAGGDSAPALGDLDADGRLDLLASNDSGKFFYFEGFVRPSHFPGLQLAGPTDPLFGQDAGSRAGPALADLDRDGDADLLAGEDLGAFRYFENTGTAIAPAFVARTGVANPLDGLEVGGGARPAFADLDADGDPDLLAGRLAGDFDYFANTGDAENPLFAASIANPFGLTRVGSESAPALVDLDADGDFDLVVGRASGSFVSFENTGSATSPAFLELTGFANPLAGVDLGDLSTPALADFDADGDLDVVAGRLDGRSRT
jgi:hypothetical protein